MQELEHIEVGQQANDGTGDPLRNGMAKVNANFAKVQTGVDAIDLTAVEAKEQAIAAKVVADAAVPKSQKGMAGGVAPLDASGRVPAVHLPELADYVRVDQVGAPGGVAPLNAGGKVPISSLPVSTPHGIAPLDALGKVPAANLPASEDAIPLSQKGVAGGVATLDVGGKVPVPQIPDAIAQAPTAISGVSASLQALDSKVAFVIVYPNGGTEAAPAPVVVNTRYVLPNPFPGAFVICEAQLKYSDGWGNTGWFTQASESYGTRASQLDGGSIVVRTGINNINSSPDGGGRANVGTLLSPVQCRVLVWRIKG